MSREAYRTFVSFIFAAAMVAWGATLFGLNPLAAQLVLLNEQTLALEKEAATSDTEPEASPTSQSNEEEVQPNIMGLLFITRLPLQVRIGGILYGIVLICFYWIYVERIIPGHVQTAIWMLPIDLIALSFMAAAAVAWVDPKTFIFLAVSTLIFLTLRFGKPAWQEHKDKLPVKKRLMTHLILVYILSGVLVCVMLLGAKWLSNGVLFSEDHYEKLYSMVLVGIAVGILVTIGHAWFNPTLMPVLFPQASDVKIRQARLTPCYDSIERLPEVAEAVLLGETRYRELLRGCEGSPLAFHLSRVHSYRDVETQAFIMAHHSYDGGNRAKEISLRSMWVYLAHWFDDIFDFYYVEKLASLLNKDNLSIGVILDRLDPRFKLIWDSAVADTAQLPGWQSAPLELGMRRLMLGGPMLSPKCANANAHFQKKHKELIKAELQRSDPYNVMKFVSGVTDRQLTFTSKVVVEIWDSFCPAATFPLSLLMDFFYAPALLAHDNTAEAEQGELADSFDNPSDSDLSKLQQVSTLILELPDVEKEWMLKPLPIFIGSFQKLLASNNSDSLEIYERVLEEWTQTQNTKEEVAR